MNNRIVVTVIGSDIFAMIMLVEAGEHKDIKALQDEFKVFEEKIGVRVFLQHEEIFKTMHRI